MRAYLVAAFRVALATSIALTALAIVLGRQNREIQDARQAAAPRHQPISGHLFKNREKRLSMLDVETGSLEPVGLLGEGTLEHAQCSPWRDGLGRTHVAGVWSRLNARDGQTTVALAHFALPGWELLGLVESEKVPSSPVCWFPDTTSRILFAGRDGCLYRFSFDDPGEGPQQLAWQTPPPRGLLMVWDPIWPSDPRLAGQIVVSLTIRPDDAPVPRSGRPARSTQLWWLQLNRDGSAIEAAGRLVSPGAGDQSPPAGEEALPMISTGVDGGLTLAYLSYHKSDSSHRLRLAPVSIDRSGRYVVDADDVIELPGRRIRARPAFSSDGRWVHAISSVGYDPDRVERISVATALSRSRPRMISSDLRMDPPLTPPRS